jgi:hypothetical protein
LRDLLRTVSIAAAASLFAPPAALEEAAVLPDDRAMAASQALASLSL